MIERKGEIYEFDGFRIEAAERQLLRNGEPVPLSSKAFDLLLTLVENNGHLVEKGLIYDRVWADSVVEDANLTVQMSAIRKALGKGYIETVKGHGYRFSADVRKVNGRQDTFVIERETFARIVVEKDVEPEHSDVRTGSPDISRKTKSADSLRTRVTALQAVIAGLLLIGAAGVAGYLLQTRGSAGQESTALPFQKASVKRLTNTGRVAYAGGAISPDGKLFAYAQSDGDLQSLWVGHTSGGEPIQIREPVEAHYTSVKFSPNNSELYYNVADQGLFRMPVFGGPPTKVRSDFRGSIAFSPNGGEFAFVRRSKGKNDEVVIARSDGSGDKPIEIQNAQLSVHSPAWSPDGSTIVVAGLVGDSDRHELFAINMHDESVKQMTTQELPFIEALAWTKDGDGLFMTIASQLWFMPYPDGKAARIGGDLSLYDQALSLSADGRSLMSVQVDQHSNIWVAPSEDLGNGRQATFSSLGRGDGWSGLDWTADGKILYTAIVGGAQSIWTMNADGTEQKQLTPTGQRSFHPSVSGDGRYVVYVSVQDRKYGVSRMNIDGTDPVRLTASDTAAQPHISPDGQWVVYIASRDGLGSIFRIPVNGGEPIKLTENAMGWIRVSPDSRLVAGAYSENQETKLAIIPIEGGQPLKTFSVPRLANFRLGVRWTPDGKAIAYRDWANGIWKQDIAGGEPKRLEGLPEEKLYSFGWSRDGKQFAFTRGAEIRDIVLLGINP